jgi:hypothetical protein
MLGAGTVINPIIKIVTTVVVLGAAYLFIVKPILDTTDKAINTASAQFDRAFDESDDAFRQAAFDSARSRAQSFAQSLQGTWPAAAREIRTCLQQAGDQLDAVKQCDSFGEKVVHTVQSDRNFALSYAHSLSAQGDSAGAARVEQCAKAAGFAPAAMQRCRDIADELLFG